MLQVLRVMRGYDENNTILLPTRNTGEKLPIELIDFYEGKWNFCNLLALKEVPFSESIKHVFLFK